MRRYIRRYVVRCEIEGKQQYLCHFSSYNDRNRNTFIDFVYTPNLEDATVFSLKYVADAMAKVMYGYVEELK